jgi:predicted ferric reductase
LQSLVFVSKILFIVFHLLQGLISMSGSYWISTVIASALVGVHLFRQEDFRARFHFAPWAASILGSLFWIAALIFEVGLS